MLSLTTQGNDVVVDFSVSQITVDFEEIGVLSVIICPWSMTSINQVYSVSVPITDDGKRVDFFVSWIFTSSEI